MKNTATHSGFTLLELMIVLAIAAILLSLAIPSMQDTQKKSSIRGLQREFTAATAFARGEAVSKNKAISICPSADGDTCDTANNNWSNGWIIFVENNGSSNGTLDAGEELIAASEYTGSSSLAVYDPLNSNANLNSLSWTNRGFAKDQQRALAVICASTGEAKYARGVLIASSGRAINTRDSNGDSIHESTFETDSNTLQTANLSCTP